MISHIHTTINVKIKKMYPKTSKHDINRFYFLILYYKFRLGIIKLFSIYHSFLFSETHLINPNIDTFMCLYIS